MIASGDCAARTPTAAARLSSSTAPSAVVHARCVIAVSTKPSTGGWKTFSAKHKASAGFAQVQCHGTSFCFALSGGSNDYWTTKAAASDSAWHGVAPPNSMSQTELACPTTTECIVGGVDGKLHVGHRR